MNKIGLNLANGQQFGSSFSVHTTRSEEGGQQRYCFDVVLHNTVAPLRAAKAYVYYSISGEDERAVERHLLQGSPFTTNEDGIFTIDGTLPDEIVNRTTFTVEHEDVSAAFSLIGHQSPSAKKPPPLPPGVHTSTRTHQVSGRIGDGMVTDEFDEGANTDRTTIEDPPPRRERTLEFALAGVKPPETSVPDTRQKADADRKPAGNKPAATPAPTLANPEVMRETLCRLLGFDGGLDLRKRLEGMEERIENLPSEKAIIALVRNQMRLGTEDVVRQIVTRVEDAVCGETQQGLDDLSRARTEHEVALREAADVLAERVAGQIIARIRKRQITPYLRSAWHWTKLAGKFAIIGLAGFSLLAVYLGWILR